MKICEICKKKIKKDDNYCRLTDYKQGKFFMESFYHTLCFQDKIKNSVAMNREMLKQKLKEALMRKREVAV